MFLNFFILIAAFAVCMALKKISDQIGRLIQAIDNLRFTMSKEARVRIVNASEVGGQD